MATHEARTKVTQVSEEHITEYEVEECTILSANFKVEVEKMHIEHDDFKANLNQPSVSS